MDWMHTLFEWTFHLDKEGNMLWTIFIMLIGLYYLLGLVFIILTSDSEKDTWRSGLIEVSLYILIPIAILLLVGVMGYWMHL
jgi:hypothetical protein